MSDPFLAEVRIVGFNFPPRGWAQCDGQLLPINQNQSLYAVIGTFYGGDGRTTFQLPDLRGRAPMHRSTTYLVGQRGGSEEHVLQAGEVPAHSHTVQASDDDATTGNPAGNVFARATSTLYGPKAAPTTLSPDAVNQAGSGQGHPNMQPYLALNFVIAIQGLFPTMN